MKDGRFRRDLLHRICALDVTLPPLRDRKEDLAVLVPALRDEAAKGIGRVEVSAAAQRAIEGHDWPGNIRELKQALRKAVVLAAERGVIEPADLGLTAAAPRPALNALDESKRQKIEEALRAHGGNRTQAAQALDIHRNTLAREMRRLGIDGADD